MPAHSAKLVSDTLKDKLRPHGFRAKGQQFVAERPESLLIVQTQRSRDSTKERVIFTVTVGVYCRRVAECAGERSALMSVYQCHWNERIGFFSPEHRDVWWTVRSIGDAIRAAEDISNLVVQRALPQMEALATTTALVELWKSGVSPGLTEVQANRYLADLTECG